MCLKHWKSKFSQYLKWFSLKSDREKNFSNRVYKEKMVKNWNLWKNCILIKIFLDLTKKPQNNRNISIFIISKNKQNIILNTSREKCRDTMKRVFSSWNKLSCLRSPLVNGNTKENPWRHWIIASVMPWDLGSTYWKLSRCVGWHVSSFWIIQLLLSRKFMHKEWCSFSISIINSRFLKPFNI